MIDGHGDDIHKYGDKIVSNFSSNIYGKQDMSLLQEYLCTQLRTIHSYPEPDAYSLAEILAKKHNLYVENILISNGATEAIYLLAQAYQGSKTTILIPTFSEYEDACTINKHKLSYCDQLEDIEKDTELVWICNPNNPNGKIYNIDDLKNLVRNHPDTLFVFDQSYACFTSAEVWNVEEASKFNNVILLHSMTKQFAIPGLRLGYVTANENIISHINSFRMPWSVNVLAIEAGKFLVKKGTAYSDFGTYTKESQRLQNELKEIKELEIIPSQMHYFLCKLDTKKASDLKQYLIENHGILIRDAANFRGLNEHYFRIATQSPTENDTLIQAIKEWI